MDSVKVEAIMKWHVMTNVTEVLSFMGLVGYYQQFVEVFSKIANPITKLQKKKRSCLDQEMHGIFSKAQGAVDNGTYIKGP
jgi:hypothetical protein